MKRLSPALFSIILFITGCIDQVETGLHLQTLHFDFSHSIHGWEGGFCDYPAESYDSTDFQLRFEHTVLPAELGSHKKGVLLSGFNSNNDLFMYLKNKVVDLEPEATYTITYDVTFASNAPVDSFDVSGSPGQNVLLKVGASEIEPKSMIDEGRYVMNIEKGNEEDGNNFVTIGNIAAPTDGKTYALVTRTNAPGTLQPEKPLIARTNARGELWLIVGTESTYQGPTTLYYTQITVVLSKPE